MTTIWGIAHREIGKRTAASWVDERVFGTFAEAYMAASVLRAAETEYEKHLSGDHGKYVRREFTVLLRWGDEPVWPTQAVDDAAIEILKSEVALLVRRGDVTWPEVLGLRCNSDEWNAIIVRMGDEAFFRKIRHTLANCSPPKHKGATYDEHLVAVYVPELIRRWSVRVSMELRAKETIGELPYKADLASSDDPTSVGATRTDGKALVFYDRSSAYPYELMRYCNFDDLQAYRMAALKATHPGIVNETYGKQADNLHIVLVDFEGRVQDPLRCIPGLDARFAARASGHESNPTSVDNDSSGPIIVDANGRHVELRNGESVTLHQEDVACERCGQASRDIFRLNNEHLGCPKCIDTARKEVAAAHEAIDAFFGDPRTEARAITAAANHVSLAYAKHAVGSVPPLYVDTDSIYTDETRSAARDARSEGGFRALEAVALSVILGPEDTSKMISLMLRIHEAEERAASAEDRLAQVLARDERSRLAVANAARDPRYAGSGRLIDLDALDLAKSWAPEDLAKVEALLVRVTAAEGRVMSAEARADLADERAKEKNDWPVAFRQPGERIPLEALRPEDFKEGEKGTSIYGLVVRKTLAEARVVELEAENARLREQAVSAGERASCLGDRCGTLEAEAADLKRQLKARR